ncbi:MAG TPA: glycosyltransferase family 1 protein [Acidimicrobiales bacterium]|nr:glycosyltransferase family 1 protein [Acidimicrobiales bacterium]
MSDGARTKVVIEAQTLTNITATSGIGTYTRHLMSALAARDDVEVWALSAHQLPLPAGVRRIPVQRFISEGRPEVMERATRTPIDLLFKRPAGAVYHNTDFHPAPGIRSPWVQTLHDVVPIVLDNPDEAVLRTRWGRFGPRYKKADAVIAISHHAADEGIRVLGLDPARVHVAHHGVDPMFAPSDRPKDDPPYLLLLSEYSRRKGFPEAFAVIDALADAGYPHRLVFVGQVRPWYTEEFEALHRSMRHPDRLDIRGYVPDIVELYQQATLFLWSTRYEGFGLPVLEAMASGTPVVAFANTAVTEVVGSGGQLVADGDVDAMVAAVRRVLDSADCAAEWRGRAVTQAGRFTWAESAAVHAEVYRSVAEGGRP